ncbi:MAG: AI-2E family transporter [Enterocloster sp.]
MGVTNVIPFFGPFIRAIPSAVLVFLISPRQCLYFVGLVWYQQFDGNILGPKILGDSTGLSSFWVLFSILFFGGLWGFVGMIVAVPLTAVVFDLFSKFQCHFLRKRISRRIRTIIWIWKRSMRTAAGLSDRNNEVLWTKKRNRSTGPQGSPR